MTSTSMDRELVDDLRAVLRRAEELVDATANTPGQRLRIARERLTDGISTLRGRWAHLEDRASDVARRGGQIVREHPYETAGTGLLLAALAVGALLLLQRSR